LAPLIKEPVLHEFMTFGPTTFACCESGPKDSIAVLTLNGFRHVVTSISYQEHPDFWLMVSHAPRKVK